MNLLESVGIPDQDKTTGSNSQTNFMKDVLSIYRYRCSVCEFSGELDDVHIGLQVAYIKWPIAGGPDNCENGLALCTQHK